MNYLLGLIPTILSLILAITLHEASHGFAAKLFGDKTAEQEGRLTLNPIAHTDLFGTVLLPLFLYLTKSPVFFGWAKPVPVDFERLKPQKLGMFVVAFAGPMTNFLLAFIAALLLHINLGVETMGNDILQVSITINIILGLFNLLPLLPLDGGRMLNAVLPKSLAEQHSKTEPYGMFVLLGLLLIPSLIGIESPLFMLVKTGYTFVAKTILFLSGHL